MGRFSATRRFRQLISSTRSLSLLAPETQGEIHGQTLTTLPLSVANALEPLRNAQDAGLNGESAEPVAEAPAGGVLTGFWILNLSIEPGGLN